MKRIKIVLLLMMMLFISACSSLSSPDASDVNDRSGSSEGMMPSFGDNDFEGISQENEETSSEKLIQTIGLEIETKQYIETIENIEGLIKRLNGYILSSYVPQPRTTNEYSNLVASFTLMIPTAKIDAFILETGEFSNVVSERREAQNVTAQYRDTEARIATLRAKELRLLELLSQSGSLSDLLLVETELSNTRYEIERLESSIKDFDTRIQYTQFYLTIREVYEFTPSDRASLWERITEEFRVNAQNFLRILESSFIFVVTTLPFILLQLLLWFIPVGLIYLLVRRLKQFSWIKRLTEEFKRNPHPKQPKDKP